MADAVNKVLGKAPLTKQRSKELLAAGWSRVCAKIGKGTFTDGLGVSPGTLDNALNHNCEPELHTALNSLLTDITALDELLGHYGLKVTPLSVQEAAAMDLLAGLGVMVGELADRLRDGKFCHNDEQATAELARELIPSLHALVAKADKRRAG
ncbi:MAG: hypothetical protein AAFW97_14665 [Pseudomonadota bacterium]